MDTRSLAEEQVCRATKAEFLHFFGSKRGDSGFGNPNRHRCQRLDLRKLLWPFVDHPVVPVQWKPVDGEDIHVVEDTLRFHVQDKVWINGRNAAQDFEEVRRLGFYGGGGGGRVRHGGENFPARIELEVPMRLIVGLVPEHYRFDHAEASQLATGGML